MTQSVRARNRWPDPPNPTASEAASWQLGQGAREDLISEIEASLHHILLIRKPSDGGSLAPLIIAGATTETWEKPVWLHPYCGHVIVAIEVSGYASDVTVTIGANSSTGRGPGLTAGASLGADQAETLYLDLELGAGDETDSGYVTMELSVTAGSGGAEVYGVHVQPYNENTVEI